MTGENREYGGSKQFSGFFGVFLFFFKAYRTKCNFSVGCAIACVLA